MAKLSEPAPLKELTPVDVENQKIADSFTRLERIICVKRANGEALSAGDKLMDREVHVKHAAWKIGDNTNEIWINGALGVCFSTGPKESEGLKEGSSRADYTFKGSNSSIISEITTTFNDMTLNEMARWHLAWLSDPNVYIDSATIDMEHNPELTVEKRQFRIKHLNISVQSNYNGIHGWLQLMDPAMESFIFRGNGILDSNRFLQLPFVSKLKKLMIIYESSFDDRTLNLLNAQHIQLASDFITDIGINKMMHRWNDQNFPIRSTFVIYYQVKNRDGIVVKMDVQESNHNDNGVSEYLIQMTNPNKRMRLIVRTSSVICTVFAVSNGIAEDENPDVQPEK